VQIEYADSGLRALCEGSQPAPTSMSPTASRALRRRIETLAAAADVADLRALKSFGLSEFGSEPSRVTVTEGVTLTIELDEGPPPSAVVQSVSHNT